MLRIWKNSINIMAFLAIAILFSSCFGGGGEGPLSIKAVTSSSTASGPTSLVFATQPSSTGTAGTDLAQQPIVEIQFDSDSSVDTSATDTITLAAYTDASCSSASTGTFNATATAAIAGVATFSGVDHEKAETIYIGASSPGFTSICSNAVTISAAAASQLAFTTQPSTSGTVASDLAQQPVVTVQDAYGNTVSDTSTITLTAWTTSDCTTTTSTGIFNSTATAAVAGVATFSGVDHTKTETIYVKATGGGYTFACSTNVVIASLFASYSFKKTITIDRSKVGAAGTGSTTITNYPFSFNSTDTDLRHFMFAGDVRESNGYDIVFGGTDSTTCGGSVTECQLDHEIELYTPNTGQFVAWVKIPSVYTNNGGNSSDTEITIYYSNASISSSQENATSVWDSDYQAVFHMDNDPSTVEASCSSRNVCDSTSVGNHLSSAGFMTNSDLVSAKVGNGIIFDGTDDNLNLSDMLQTGLNPGSNNFTIEAWINTAVAGRYIGGKHYINGSSHHGWALFVDDDTNMGGFEPTAGDSGGSYNKVTSATDVNDGTYHYVVMVRVGNDPDDWLVYVDGALEGSPTVCGSCSDPIGSNVTTTQQFAIGGHSSGSMYFSGTIDEFRVSTTTRSADYVATNYNNQNAPGTFYTVGAETAN